MLMPFIRLCDSYIDHPKFLALNATAFRLWHEGMAFCRKHQTDGLIAQTELQGFRYYQPIRATELSTPHKPGAAPLWEVVEGFGYKVHDYLDWNPSKEVETERRAETKRRMQKHRVGAQPPPFASRDTRTPTSTASAVPDRIGNKKEQETENDAAERAGSLLRDLYPAWYSKYRHGAKLRLMGNSLEFQDAMSLVALWDDERLEQLAKIVLTTNDEYIAGTDRGFKIFALKASWADSRLSELEAAS